MNDLLTRSCAQDFVHQHACKFSITQNISISESEGFTSSAPTAFFCALHVNIIATSWDLNFATIIANFIVAVAIVASFVTFSANGALVP